MKQKLFANTMAKINARKEARKNRTQIEKDMAFAPGRIVRHTLLKKKYGDMQHYHMDAVDHMLANYQPKDIDEVVVEAEKEMDEYLESQEKKSEEAAAKKAEREAKRAEKKAEREAKKAAKNAEAPEVTTEAEDPDKSVNGVSTSMKKGEDGLYHYSPVVFHDEKEKKESKKSSKSKK